MKISLCIPMYNEGSIIESTLNAVSEYMEANFDDYEVLFSDDGSTDNCRRAVEGFPNERIRAVGYEENKGKGAAIRHGVMSAVGDIIIFTDCDAVIGSRNLTEDGYEGYTPLRKLASKTYIKCLALAAGFKLSDSQCGFKCFRRGTAHRIFSECAVNGFAFDFEVLIKANNMGAKILEMPVKIINHRESKVNVLRDSFKMLSDVRKIKKANRKK